MMALAVENDMIVEQLDVTSAYLNDTLKEKIFMEVPKYLREDLDILAHIESTHDNIRKKVSNILLDLKEENKVCLFDKPIYGLCQAGRCWNEKLCNILVEFGAKRFSDPCIFFKGLKQSLILIAI